LFSHTGVYTNVPSYVGWINKTISGWNDPSVRRSHLHWTGADVAVHRLKREVLMPLGPLPGLFPHHQSSWRRGPMCLVLVQHFVQNNKAYRNSKFLYLFIPKLVPNDKKYRWLHIVPQNKKRLKNFEFRDFSWGRWSS